MATKRGIGAFAGGLAQGFTAGTGIAQRNTALRQQQQRIDLETEQQEVSIEQIRNSLNDARTTAQALAGVTKVEQADAQMFGMLKSARDLAGADASMRKTQFPVFAANFKKATGRDMAPNVQEAFLKGDSATLTALIDNATNSVLKGNGKAEDVLGLLSDPTRSAAWLASNAAQVGAARGTPNTESPQANSLQVNVSMLKRRAGLAQQKADALAQAAGQQTTVEGLKSVTDLMSKYQKEADTLLTKAADLSKPVNVSQGGALVDLGSGAIIAEREPRPVNVTAGGRLVNPGDGSTVAEGPPKTRPSKLLTPEEEEQAIRVAGGKAQAQAEGKMAGLGESLTIEGPALDRAAATFNIDNSLPSLGRGVQGIAARLKIMRRAAELSEANGDTGQTAATRAQFNKTLISGMRQLQAQKMKISSFERTAMKNIELVKRLSPKADRTGVPVFNRWLLAGKKQIAGDKEVSDYHVALRGVINEYARIVSTATGGGVLTDTARKEMEDILNPALTIEQLESALNVAKIEMQNRISSFDEEFAAARAQFTGPQPGDADFKTEDRTPGGGKKTKPTIVRDDRGWVRMTDASGNEAWVGPKGQVEEITQ